jgi:TRAP-type C4-dicarboxylate transport system permease large subunit
VIAAIAVLAIFLVFALLMYRRLVPAILAVPVMAVAMALAAGVPPIETGAVVTAGAVALAPVYVTVIFGALLARVTLDTGIARALVNVAAEYGGEAPLPLALILCAVVALLFTSLSGLGAIIMVGSIVLPIMMTTGVPRTVAATLFLMAFALGFIFNLTNWRFYTQLFGVVPEQMVHYAQILAGIDALALVVYAVVSFARERNYATWAVRRDDDALPKVPAAALLTPILPLVLYFALHLDPMLAFVVSAMYGAIVTRGTRAVEALIAAAIRGVEDVAPAVLLFIGIGMLLAATKTPQFTAALAPLVSGWASNPIAFVAVFGLGSPLVLYRGPLNPFGVGIAVFTVLLATHALPPVVLVAAVMAVVQVQNVCDPTNTANVWVANFTGTPIDTITKRTLPFQVAVATLALLVVVLSSPQLFGMRAFADAATPALAAPLGLEAPPAASEHLAVDSDGSPLGRAAAAQVIATMNHPPLAVFAWHGDPNAGDCSVKPFTAYAFVNAATFALTDGTDLSVAVRLEDCGGWIVDEWHEHELEAGTPNAAQAQALAAAAAARLEDWAARDPRAAALFARGVAAGPGEAPGYLYALTKTVDGNMRAYVRAGGPAYAAGLRTGDIVTKVDGHFWWEYGTYQTQARAYDGKPHSFEVQRGSTTLDVQL